MDRDTLGLCLFDDLFDNRRTGFVEERATNLQRKLGQNSRLLFSGTVGSYFDAFKLLFEGESHPAGNDQDVDFVDEVVDELNLVGNLGSASASDQLWSHFNNQTQVRPTLRG